MTQNAAKDEKPTQEEFGQMLEAIRRRIPKDAFASGADYALKMMDVGLGLRNSSGKDAVILLLAATAMAAAAGMDDIMDYQKATVNEVRSRALYDKDYESLAKFMDLLKKRYDLSDATKTIIFKEETMKILDKHYKREEPKDGGTATAVAESAPETVGTVAQV